jgi:hypothetical protein
VWQCLQHWAACVAVPAADSCCRYMHTSCRNPLRAQKHDGCSAAISVDCTCGRCWCRMYVLVGVQRPVLVAYALSTIKLHCCAVQVPRLVCTRAVTARCQYTSAPAQVVAMPGQHEQWGRQCSSGACCAVRSTCMPRQEPPGHRIQSLASPLGHAPAHLRTQQPLHTDTLHT